MSARGINLYRVEASAASVQRPLISFWRYLANENYDLSSKRFYGTSTLVSLASCWSSRLRLYAYQNIKRTGLVQPRLLLCSRCTDGNNSIWSCRYLSKNDDIDLGRCRTFFSYLAEITCGTRITCLTKKYKMTLLNFSSYTILLRLFINIVASFS